ncbi:MAG: hypothetical protein AAFX06_26170, partial [Planctomycetota bacterium]
DQLEAAKWLLKNKYIGMPWKDLTEKERDDFGKILELVCADQPFNTQLHELHAEHLIVTDQRRRAAKVLEDVSYVRPFRGLQAVALLRQLGEDKAAKQLAKRVLPLVKVQFEKDPDPRLGLTIARNQCFLKQFEEADVTLRATLRLTDSKTERSQLAGAISDLHVLWEAHLRDGQGPSYEARLRRIRLIQTATQWAVNNSRAASSLLYLVDESTPSTAPSVEGTGSFGERTTEPLHHLIRGMRLLIDGDNEQARKQIDIAQDEMKQVPALLNNVAIALAKSDEPRMGKALVLCEEAFRRSSAPTLRFYETRATILFQTDRYADAIPDLKRALKDSSSQIKVHQMLAECYNQTGDEQLHQFHLKKLRELASGGPEASASESN